MSTNRIVVCIAGLLATTVLAACGDSSTDTASAGASAGTANGPADNGGLESIFFSNPLPAYPDWAAADKCFRERAEELGIDASSAGPTGLAPDNSFNVDRIRQAITQGVDAIAVVPVSPEQFNPLMQQAKDKDIKVATLQTGALTDLQDFTIGTDFDSLGASVAEAIGERDGEQKLGLVSNAPGVPGDLIFEALKEALPSNVTIVDTAYDGGDPSQTPDAVSRMLTAHPDINVIYSWQGTAVAGMTTAIKEQDKVGEVVAVTNDLTDQVQAGIEDGTVYGTNVQDFCGMGAGVVDNLVKVAKGEQVETSIDTGTTFVTADTLDEALAEQ
jgi:ABC-type sugar transport system substrate-binding protein